MKKTIIAVSLAAALCSDIASAASMTNASITIWIDNLPSPPDTTVTGSIGGGAWSVASTVPFFGVGWTANGGTTFGPGSYDVNTANVGGGVGLSGTVAGCGGGAAGCYEGIVVGAGQVGGHILFNWGATSDIDVVNVWNVTDNGDGTFDYISTDVELSSPASLSLDGVPGLAMFDGPFPGYDVNFQFTTAVPIPAAVWLFGSGLLGLIGVARRKRYA